MKGKRISAYCVVSLPEGEEVAVAYCSAESNWVTRSLETSLQERGETAPEGRSEQLEA